MKFKTKLAQYSVVETADGSLTLHSGLYDENCHSTSGAHSETLYNYIQGCDVINRANKSDITIFEVGLGVGIGPLATYNETINCSHKVRFISTEIDPELAQWVIEQDAFSKLITKKEISDKKILVSLGNKFELIILLGDARKTIKYLSLEDIKIDCIFQDAFSPGHNPTLWTKEWFRNLRSFCHDNSVMTTYSAAVKIRKAMLAAGFFVTNMPGFGNKRSATRAYTNAHLRDEELENGLCRSKTPPFSDKDI